MAIISQFISTKISKNYSQTTNRSSLTFVKREFYKKPEDSFSVTDFSVYFN